MTEELKIAIEDLYFTFSAYPVNHFIDGCPCCVSNSDKEKIHSKALKELKEEDLSRYTFKSMTTWGNVNDFKHFLPRIFELLSTKEFIVENFVVLGKLEYGEWRTWPEQEQKAIDNFLYTWWVDLIKKMTYFDIDDFTRLIKLTKNIEALLSLWKISFEDNSFVNYIDFLEEYYVDLINKRKHFKDISPEEADAVLEWSKINAGKLEEGFFYFENIDKEFAKKISRALCSLEKA